MSFRAFWFDCVRYTVEHLDRFEYKVEDMLGNTYTCKVEFSCHCFTKECEFGDLEDQFYYWNDEKRTICMDRYNKSKSLPDIIKNQLPHIKVHRLHHKNFFIVKAHNSDGKIEPYTIFFNVMKSKERDIDIKIIINSAYVKPKMITEAYAIRFDNLLRLKYNEQEINLIRKETIIWI